MEKKIKSYASTGPRMLDKTVLLQKAIDFNEDVGGGGFSLRKLSKLANCDPMTLIYHFKSKEGLQRAMAGWLTDQLKLVEKSINWSNKLFSLAEQYRQLALNYPQTFVLLQRYFHTGISDLIHIEMVYDALTEAGVTEADLPGASLGWHATVYGLAIAEISGLTRSASQDELSEISSLSVTNYPRLHGAIPYISKISPSEVFRNTLRSLHEGLYSKYN